MRAFPEGKIAKDRFVKTRAEVELASSSGLGVCIGDSEPNLDLSRSNAGANIGIDLSPELALHPENETETEAEAEAEADSDGTDASTRRYKALLQSQVLGLQRAILRVYQPTFDENMRLPQSLHFAPLHTPRVRTVSSKAGACICTSASYSLSPACGLDAADLFLPYHDKRRIPKSPSKVLDAPALQDDYYLDVIDWSKQNILSVGLGKALYLWAACTSKVTKVHEYLNNDSVASVAWCPTNPILAVGSSKGFVQIWDAATQKLIHTTRPHQGRIGTMCWSPSSALLTTGSRDKTVTHSDIRAGVYAVTSHAFGHKQEVCGVRWSPDEQYLSSGGNDNKVFVWPRGKLTSAIHRLTEHTAAVKALAWSPHQHSLLATGGGTADRCLRFWDVNTGHSLSCLDTGSQICNMIWSPNANELVTTHGYSQNQIILWECHHLRKLAVLRGHMSRVLYLSLSPDAQTIVTGSGDETLRFWPIFPPHPHQRLPKSKWQVLPSETNVR